MNLITICSVITLKNTLIYITNLALRINCSGSAIITVSNNFLINLPLHGFYLLLVWLIGSPFLFIYSLGKTVSWRLILLDTAYIFLSFWYLLKDSCYPSSNMEFTHIARHKKLIPILGLCFTWLSYCQSLFYCYTLHINTSQMLSMLEFSNVANLVLFQFR